MEIVNPAHARRRESLGTMIEDDDRYLKNIKLDVSNFDNRLDSQYYLDWVMSIERYFKWYETSQERRVCFAAMKLVGQAGQY